MLVQHWPKIYKDLEVFICNGEDILTGIKLKSSPIFLQYQPQLKVNGHLKTTHSNVKSSKSLETNLLSSFNKLSNLTWTILTALTLLEFYTEAWIHINKQTQLSFASIITSLKSKDWYENIQTTNISTIDSHQLMNSLMMSRRNHKEWKQLIECFKAILCKDQSLLIFQPLMSIDESWWMNFKFSKLSLQVLMESYPKIFLKFKIKCLCFIIIRSLTLNTNSQSKSKKLF